MNREDIQPLVDAGLTIREIGKTLGKSDTAIRYWLKKYDLVTLKSKYLVARIDTLDVDELQQIVDAANSRSDVLRYIYPDTRQLRGYLYERLDERLETLGISTDHFNPYAPKTKIPDSGVFVKDCTLSKSAAARRIRGKIDMTACALCGVGTMWNGQPLVLQIDHINGVNNDNRLSNLRALCPNCHSQTATFTGRNNTGKPRLPTKKERFCMDCNAGLKSKNASRCRSCANIARRSTKQKIQWPTCEDLLLMLETSNYRQVGRTLNVSDNAVRGHIKMYCNC